MSMLEIIMGVILIVLAIAVTLIVLFQEGNERPSAGVTGIVSDTFLTKHKSRSIDAFLERWTKIIAVGFFISVIAVNVVLYFHVFGI